MTRPETARWLRGPVRWRRYAPQAGYSSNREPPPAELPGPGGMNLVRHHDRLRFIRRAPVPAGHACSGSLILFRGVRLAMQARPQMILSLVVGQVPWTVVVAAVLSSLSGATSDAVAVGRVGQRAWLGDRDGDCGVGRSAPFRTAVILAFRPRGGNSLKVPILVLVWGAVGSGWGAVVRCPPSWAFLPGQAQAYGTTAGQCARGRPGRRMPIRARLTAGLICRPGNSAARRAPDGPSTAEPGADAGPGAAQRRRLI
jgi:hypothetical protein